jgi:hypothetical protein
VSTLINSSALVIYEDSSANNNPLAQNVNWRRTIPATVVSKPLSDKYSIPPNVSQILFSGTRTTAIDGTTVFSIALNNTNPNLYRVTYTSGTAPVFRTDRALTLSGSTITVAINNNATATFTTSAGNFNAVVVGDVVFVPTALTGDSSLNSPFNVLNGGFWTVLAKTVSVLTLMRLPGQTFSGVAEAVALTSNAQLQAFSSAGVQVGDTLEISAGFSPVTQRTFIVSTVTPTIVEFLSTVSLPLETGISPVTGMAFYSSAKRFIRIETDQEIAVRLNGDTSSNCRVSPRVAGDLVTGFGSFEKWGPTWSLEVVNRSRSATVNLIVISAE